MLLDYWYFFGSDFDAEVSASDHDTVGGLENFFQMIDGLRFFEFGDDWDITAVRGDDPLGFANIGSRTDEGLSDGIDAVPKSEFEVPLVFLCKRRDGESDAGEIDALVLAKHASVDDVAEDVFAADRTNAEFYETVAKEDARPRS